MRGRNAGNQNVSVLVESDGGRKGAESSAVRRATQEGRVEKRVPGWIELGYETLTRLTGVGALRAQGVRCIGHREVGRTRESCDVYISRRIGGDRANLAE